MYRRRPRSTRDSPLRVTPEPKIVPPVAKSMLSQLPLKPNKLEHGPGAISAIVYVNLE